MTDLMATGGVGTDGGRRLRVVTWNMNHWRQPVRPVDTRAEGWRFLREELAPDVALVQEAVPPAPLEGETILYREIADYRPWGSAIVARGGLGLTEIWSVRTPFDRRRFTLANTFPGSVAIGEVTFSDRGPITFVSVYTVIDVYAQTTLLRMVADLVPLFDSSKGSRVVLAGDLNTALTTQDPYYLKRGEAFLGALRGLGLVEATEVAKKRPEPFVACPCGSGGSCRHVPTWQNLELDHVFVSESLADEVAGLAVKREAVDRGLSDHSPLVVDLTLSGQPIERRWDPEAVTDEIGRLLGEDAKRVVTELIARAEDKERRVREANRKGVRLTRLPCSTGVVPEMWFQIDFAGQRLPMYTVSVKGTGQVVVQFQYMLYPPFDDQAGRASLLAQLNAIEGVSVEARLNGRPTFALSALTKPAALAAFIAVLERIVDETLPERSARASKAEVDDPGIDPALPDLDPE